MRYSQKYHSTYKTNFIQSMYVKHTKAKILEQMSLKKSLEGSHSSNAEVLSFPLRR